MEQVYRAESPGDRLLLAVLFGCLTASAGAYEDGVTALRAGHAASARDHLLVAVDKDPEAASAWWELGWAHWVLQDFSRAESAWRRVAELDPTRADLDHWLSIAEAKAALSRPVTAAAPVEEEPRGSTLVFRAAGDTMMGTDMRRGASGLAPGNGESIFDGSRTLFQGADVAFLNHEGVLADGLPDAKCGDGRPHCYSFGTPTRYTAALASAGIDMVSLANNHAMDLGPRGMRSSMAALDEVGIAHAGRFDDVGIIERDGITIALVAAHSGEWGCLNVNRLGEVTQAIRAADATADLVVFSFHGGAEGYAHRHVPGKLEIAWGEKRGDVKALARAAVDAGADLVLGHGPHVLRAVEVYRGRLVAYSMGNFVGYKQFGTKGGYGGTSMIVEAEVASNGALVSARLHPMALDGRGVPAPDPARTALAHVRELTAADFPGGGIVIGEDGRIEWSRSPTQGGATNVE